MTTQIGLPLCWIPGWGDLSLATKRKIYRETKAQGHAELSKFKQWLEDYYRMPHTKAKTVVTRVWVAWVFSHNNPIEWLRDLDVKKKSDWVNAMRLWCRWTLATVGMRHENREWIQENLPELDKLYSLAKGDENRRKYRIQRNKVIPPLTESEIVTVEEAIEESLNHPQYPWAKYLLKAAFTTGATTRQLSMLTPDNIENLINRWKSGGSPTIGIQVAPRGRNASKQPGRKRLHPANWTLPQFEALLDLSIEWQTVAHVVLPRVPRTKIATNNTYRLAGITMSDRLVEVVGPIVSQMRQESRLMRYDALHALLVTTTQARLIRELGDWATAAQLKDWSVGYLHTLKWAQEAYRGPDRESVWNTQVRSICHSHPRRRKRILG